MKNDKLLAQVEIKGQQYSIRATAHAVERMEQRNIDEYVVVGNIMAMGKERIVELQSKNEEAILIDDNTNTSIVFGFNGNKVKVITVIDKSNVFVKKGTVVERL